MTLINHTAVNPFLAPRPGKPAREEPSIPFDDSEEGMRRLRHPFAVDPAASTTGKPTSDTT